MDEKRKIFVGPSVAHPINEPAESRKRDSDDLLADPTTPLPARSKQRVFTCRDGVTERALRSCALMSVDRIHHHGDMLPTLASTPNGPEIQLVFLARSPINNKRIILLEKTCPSFKPP